MLKHYNENWFYSLSKSSSAGRKNISFYYSKSNWILSLCWNDSFCQCNQEIFVNKHTHMSTRIKYLTNHSNSLHWSKRHVNPVFPQSSPVYLFDPNVQIQLQYVLVFLDLNTNQHKAQLRFVLMSRCSPTANCWFAVGLYVVKYYKWSDSG